VTWVGTDRPPQVAAPLGGGIVQAGHVADNIQVLRHGSGRGGQVLLVLFEDGSSCLQGCGLIMGNALLGNKGDCQRLIEKSEPARPGQPHDQLPILKARKILVKEADLNEKAPAHQQSCRGDEGLRQDLKGKIALLPGDAGWGRISRLGAVQPEKTMVDNTHSNIAVPEDRHLFLEFVGHPHIVTVLEGNELPPCRFDACISCRRSTLVFPVTQKAESRICNRGENRCRVIRGGIIHNDQLEASVRLRQHTPYGPFKKSGAVVGGKYDADCRDSPP